MATAIQQAKTMTLGELLPGVQLFETEAATPVQAITADSRAVVPGALFLAFPGLRADGRHYIDQAIAAGAAVVLAESSTSGDNRESSTSGDNKKSSTSGDNKKSADLGSHQKSVPVIPVSGLAKQVSEIAGRFYGEPSKQLRMTGVTGTNGKTTCTQLLAQLADQLGECAGVIGTLGYGLLTTSLPGAAPLGEGGGTLRHTGMTTPDAVQTQEALAQMRDGGATHIFMEVSSHSLDQGRVSAVNFHTAIFTNLSRDHLDYHGDLNSYATAKAALFDTEGLQLAVVNGDDPVSDEMVAGLPSSVHCYRFAVNNAHADVVASDLQLSDTGIKARISTPWGEGKIESALLGEFNVSNLLAVITAACGQGHSLAQVLEAVKALRPVAGRMEIVNAHIHPTVVVDYAHTPDALEKALLAMRSHCRGELWCVFGCGGDRDKGKRPQMGAIAARLAHRVVVTSDNPRSEDQDRIIVDILAGVPDALSVTVVPDRAAAIREAIVNAAPQDCVLIAGKGHEDYQEIQGQKLPFSDVSEALGVLQHQGECL